MHVTSDCWATTVILFIVKPIACVITDGRKCFSWEKS